MANYLWRKLSEKDKKEIEEQAKKIMFDFGKALDDLPEVKEAVVDRKIDRRKEGEGINCDNDFREIMLDNAPNSKDGFIVAEKGGWVE